jgi:hypothetical protein
MYKITFIIGDSIKLETIESNMIPVKDSVVLINKGKFKVVGVCFSYKTNEVLVYV